VCSGTIDDDRVRAAQSRGKEPRYCSTRCYRAGIKRVYRAKHGSITPPAIDERRPEATATLDLTCDEQRAFEEGRDEMRGHILEARRELRGAPRLSDVVGLAEIFQQFFRLRGALDMSRQRPRTAMG
jgi:hypothetical protein